jgi:hypothetical protein
LASGISLTPTAASSLPAKERAHLSASAPDTAAATSGGLQLGEDRPQLSNARRRRERTRGVGIRDPDVYRRNYAQEAAQRLEARSYRRGCCLGDLCPRLSPIRRPMLLPAWRERSRMLPILAALLPGAPTHRLAGLIPRPTSEAVRRRLRSLRRASAHGSGEQISAS